MNPILVKTTTSRFLPLAWLSIMLGLAVGLSPAIASAEENLQVKNDIINLMLCYGKGTDTFGVANNPDSYYEGLAIYEGCFTEDAIFNLWPPGADFGSPPPLSITGPQAWANFVASGLSGNSLGQHMLTNFIVETRGNTGTLTAYLSATRATYGPSGAVTNVAVANGTYTLHVEKFKNKWMVTELDLKLISFVDHFTADFD